MNTTFADLWRPSGTVDRKTYALVGLAGFAIKHNLDRVIATLVFRRPWSLFNYWAPVSHFVRITELRSGEANFLLTMVAISLPFIWLGVTMTMKRLRSAQLPMPLVILFFVPFLNLVFFLALSLIPQRSIPAKEDGPHSLLARVVPHSAVGSAMAAISLTAPIGWGLAMVGTLVLRGYGFGLFLALPFAVGLSSALIYGIRQPRSLGGCVQVALLSIALVGAALLALALEGLLCLIMSIPIAVPLAIFGGVCGYYLQRGRRFHDKAPVVLSVMLLFVPGVQLTERVAAPTPPSFVVHSSVDIDAPPERVWKQVVAFTEIAPPKEWMFRAGIAYPIRAEIYGSGPGAERHCVFSTGAFVEPIEVWDEPRRLKFAVASNPPPMAEWTPYAHIDPPHLHGFLISDGGQFLLTPLSNGGTRLEGTTWYHHGLRPAGYWKLWSDAIIHRIHMRVLMHIRDMAEKQS